MGDLFSREAAIDAIAGLPNAGLQWYVSIERVFKAIEKLPSIEEKPKTDMFECTCYRISYSIKQLMGLRNYMIDSYAPKYCPNCGAKMESENE